jgi:RHS repeat-associated protein
METTCALNKRGTVAETLDYYPYGGQRIDNKVGSYVGEKNKYAQTQYDSVSGLNYAQARYQNPTQGQFLSQDPIFLGDPRQQTLTDPQSLNSYSYANDNPITHSDPNGKYVEVSTGGTFLWFSGSVGVRFNLDLSAAVAFVGAGPGYGVGGHLIGVSYTPGASVPRTTETSVSAGGDLLFFGGSVSGKYIPNTVSIQDPKLGGSLNYGIGRDWYVRKEVSTPVMGGLAPDGLTFGDASNFSTPNYVAAQRSTPVMSSGSPSIGTYRPQTAYNFSIPGVSSGSSQTRSSGNGGNWGAVNPAYPHRGIG